MVSVLNKRPSVKRVSSIFRRTSSRKSLKSVEKATQEKVTVPILAIADTFDSASDVTPDPVEILAREEVTVPVKEVENEVTTKVEEVATVVKKEVATVKKETTTIAKEETTVVEEVTPLVEEVTPLVEEVTPLVKEETTFAEEKVHVRVDPPVKKVVETKQPVVKDVKPQVPAEGSETTKVEEPQAVAPVQSKMEEKKEEAAPPAKETKDEVAMLLVLVFVPVGVAFGLLYTHYGMN